MWARRGRSTALHGVPRMSVVARRTRRIGWGLATVLVITLLPEAPAWAAPAGNPPDRDKAPGVAVQRLPWTPRPLWTATGREVRGDAAVAWPAAASATVDLSRAGAVSARDVLARGTAAARAAR